MRNRYVPVLTAVALLTAAASVGQPQTVDPSTGITSTQPATPSTSQSASQATTTQSSTQTSTQAGTAGNALAGQDATFLQRAMAMGRLEVVHAQAALDDAQRTDTKTAARTLLEDHQRAHQQLQQLASRKGWNVPAEAESAESDQARMASSAGNFDDDRFMAEQIRMHRDAISLYRAQASSGSDPDLRQFASDQLPHLEHHLEMLQGSHTQK
jgi:putative membrane protein